MDAASRYARLPEEQERAMLCHICQLRRQRWIRLLDHPDAAPTLLRWLSTRSVCDDLRAAMEKARPEAWRNDESVRASDLAALADAASAHDLDHELANELHDQILAALNGDPTAPFELDRCSTGDRYRSEIVAAKEELFEARRTFACTSLKLVVFVAGRFSGDRMPLPDRIQEGNVGLLKAIDRFDPERGTRFSTYATWWIRFSISRALTDQGRTVRVPAYLHRVFSRVRRRSSELRDRLGRTPSVSEVAASLDLPERKVEDATAAMQTRGVALDAHTSGPGSRLVGETLAAPADPSVDRFLDDKRNLELAEEAMDTLSDIERDVLDHRFQLNGHEHQTLREIGLRHALSHERIRQIQNRALMRLRQAVQDSPRGAMTGATAPSISATVGSDPAGSN